MLRNIQLSKLENLEDFEVQGYWWLPDGEEYEHSGNLYLKDGVFYLDILGGFTDSFDETYEHNYIFGFTTRGEKITLINSLITNKQFRFPGIANQEFKVNEVLVGGHIDNFEEFKANSLSIVSPYLTNWFGNSFLTRERNTDPDNHQIIKVSYPEIDKFYIEKLGATISNTPFITSNGGSRNHYSSSLVEHLKITPDENKNYFWFKETALKISKLMTLLVDKPMYLQKIIFHSNELKFPEDDNKIKKSYFLYFSQENKQDIKPIPNHRMLFTYTNIKDNLEIIFNNWIEKEEQLQNVYNLHLTKYFSKDQYLETKFLNSIQSLEVYHRSIGHGKLFSDKDRDNYISTLENLMNDSIPEDIQKNITGKLKFFNEYTLRKRLEEINNSLESETREFLFESNRKSKSFIYRAVNTRNYLTHYGEDSQTRYEGIKMYYANVLLKTLASIILFKEIGLDEQVVLSAMNEQYSINQQVQNAKKGLELI